MYMFSLMYRNVVPEAEAINYHVEILQGCYISA